MGETTDSVTPSTRRGDDVLMGAFGTPDSGNTIKQATSSSSASITTFKKQKWYRFVATQDCYLHFHASEAATSSHMFLKAGIPEVFYTGNFSRVAVIRDSADGNLFATPLMTNDRQA